MNSPAITLREPPRGRPFGGGGVHPHGGLGALAPIILVYRDPGYPHSEEPVFLIFCPGETISRDITHKEVHPAAGAPLLR